MRTKRWGSAALVAVLVAMCSAATPTTSEADPGSEPTSTHVSCPRFVTAGTPLTCVGTVTGTSSNTAPDGDVLTFSFDRGGLSDSQCVLEGGTCTMSVVPMSAAVGTLTVTATYPGGVDYGASAGTATVLVDGPTRLIAKPAIANLISPTKVNLQLSARLTNALDGTPIPGEVIYFYFSKVVEVPFCTVDTDANGVATCTMDDSDIGFPVVALGYRARFNGSREWLRATTTGPGVRI